MPATGQSINIAIGEGLLVFNCLFVCCVAKVKLPLLRKTVAILDFAFSPAYFFAWINSSLYTPPRVS